MDEVLVRYATAEDYPEMAEFFKIYYKPGHPLYKFEFWQWQYGNPERGSSILAINERGKIVGHMGCCKGGSLVWLMNIVVDRIYSSMGVITRFFDAAREYGPIAVAVANPAGQGVLQKKQWYRYADLQRYVLVNPKLANRPVEDWVQPLQLVKPVGQNPGGHYWEQPGLDGILMADGSTAVWQPYSGGLRIVDIQNHAELAEQAWALGFNWIDYVASWNHPLCRVLEKAGWTARSALPWYLNPVDFNMIVPLNLFSEEALPRDFLFHRTYADMARVGSL